MQFKQYPIYKNSGVEWLGDVPEHWNLKRFGYLFDENKKKNIGLKETNVLSLSYGNIKEKNIDDNKGLLPESFETYQIIEPNDIVFRFTDLQNDKRSLRSAISKYHGIITSAYIAVKTKQNADFYNYLFRAYDLQKVFYSMGEGMRQSLKMDELNKMPVVLPSEDEQKRIVAFLNTETTRIDNLIAKQEKLIELLEEQRKSVISHAVTKGLDPNAPMKDSGVEWLGEVPESWEVIPSKFYFTERKEKAVNGDKQLTASQKHGIIYQDEFIAENGRVMVVMKNPEILKKVRPNDFVISMRSFQGGLELSSLEGSISSAYVMLKPDLSLINTEYFKYLFKTPRYIQSLQSTSNLIRDGQALRFNNFSQVKLVLPPKSEQQEIVEYLDKEKNKIDNLIYKQKTLIEKLKEYRASIISHAVTGKIDVREFGA